MTLTTFLVYVVVLVLLLILLAILRVFVRRWRSRRHSADRGRKASRARCATVPPHIYRRPDPMIYDQAYLMSQGLAVTWDNPDIELRLGGVAVPSGSLKPATEYDVVARIWNGSIDAPAVNMPVRFSYLDFGIGGVSVPVGSTTADLPVKGAPGCPAFAHMKWTTPATPGHYCLQVELIWSDDANPSNNLGQENTQVKPLNSPHAAFTFPVRNATRQPQSLRLQVDTYSIPARRPCDRERIADSPRMGREELAQHRRDAVARHGLAGHPLPSGWRVVVQPPELRLGPGEQRDVTVDVNAPDGFTGRQALNVNAFDMIFNPERPRLTGGVTLYVEG